jgi:hypothetical protein
MFSATWGTGIFGGVSRGIIAGLVGSCLVAAALTSGCSDDERATATGSPEGEETPITAAQAVDFAETRMRRELSLAGHRRFHMDCEAFRQDGVWLVECFDFVSEANLVFEVEDDGKTDYVAGEIPDPSEPTLPPPTARAIQATSTIAA